MSPSKQSFTFAINDELKRLLSGTRKREGIPEAEQIRRGLRMWFESKGYRFDEDGAVVSEPAGQSAGSKERSVKSKSRA